MCVCVHVCERAVTFLLLSQSLFFEATHTHTWTHIQLACRFRLAVIVVAAASVLNFIQVNYKYIKMPVLHTHTGEVLTKIILEATTQNEQYDNKNVCPRGNCKWIELKFGFRSTERLCGSSGIAELWA